MKVLLKVCVSKGGGYCLIWRGSARWNGVCVDPWNYKSLLGRGLSFFGENAIAFLPATERVGEIHRKRRMTMGCVVVSNIRDTG